MHTAVPFTAWIGGLVAVALLSAGSAAAQKTAPAKPRAAAKKTVKKASAPAPVEPKQPAVLTNDSIVRLLRSGNSEPEVIAVIESSPAQFNLDADNLAKLNEQKVPAAVIQAMLKKAPSAPATHVPPEPVAAAAPPPPPPIPFNLDRPLARQGAATFPLADRPQKVVFVKSESGTAKDAIADLLLSDVGLNLITMGMASQMKMWNPYFGDTLSKARSVGKGLLRSKGADTQGFEYYMLAGTTSERTLGAGPIELFIPMSDYLASADVNLAEVRPVLLRLETREQDGSRLVAARRVLLKETKKGRFDFKPKVERQELGLEQNDIAVDVELTGSRVYRVTPKQDLAPGEYALVFRRQTEPGGFTADLPLRPTAVQEPEGAMAFDGEAETPQQPARRGLFGRSKPSPQPAEGADGSIAGFIAFDFRVVK